MPNIVEIIVKSVDATKEGFESANKGSKGFSDIAQKAGALAGVALIGVGIKATEMASQFQSATTRLSTSAGESVGNLKMVGQGMLDMAGKVGISAKDLATGMYTVESAGYHGADGLKVLQAAAEGAKDENADLGTVANAVTDALVDYHLKATDAADVTSKLVTAVSYGKTTFQDLGASMHTVLPLASAMHLNLNDVLGVLAEMTAHGVGAAQATQNMANVMRHLAAPTGTMIAEFGKMGITAKQVRDTLSTQGLSGTLQLMSQTALKAGKEGTPAYTAALAKLVGTAQGLNVALQTTGENTGKTQAAIAGISKASADAKGNVAGFAETQKTLKQQEDQLSASFGAMMIELGQKLLPVLTSVTGYFAKHRDVLVTVTAAIAGLLIGLATYSAVMKTIAIATKVWAAAQFVLDAAMDANPIGLVVIAIAALAAGLIYAYKHSETFRNIVNTAFASVVAQGEWLWKMLKVSFNAIVKGVELVGKGIAQPFISAFNAIRWAWNSTIGGKGFSIPGWVPGIGGDSFTIPRFASGGNTGGGGMALVGENGPGVRQPGARRQGAQRRFDRAGIAGWRYGRQRSGRRAAGSGREDSGGGGDGAYAPRGVPSVRRQRAAALRPCGGELSIMVYPATGYPTTEILINGVWTDVSSYVRQGDGTSGITIVRGRQDEQGRVSPTTSDFELNNRDGRFSNRNPTGLYYGAIPRNTQVRHTAGTPDRYMRTPYDDQLTVNRAETADKAVLHITGDLEVRVDVWPHTWRPSNLDAGTTGAMDLAAKYLITGNQRAWALYVNASGTVTLLWSTDGTITGRIFATSTAVIPATSTRLSIKATLDVNNGATGNTVTFYTASSITGTYTQLGSPVVTAGVTSIFAGTGKLTAGTADDFADVITGHVPFGGKYYGLRVYNGIGGTEVARFDPTVRTIGDTTWSDGLATPNTWFLTTPQPITSDGLRFWGALASLPQAWDVTGTDVYMPVEAGGLLRRLDAAGSPLRSPMYRKFSTLSGLSGYWTFEDGQDSTSPASALPGGFAAKVADVKFQADTTLPGADGSIGFNSSSGSVVMQPGTSSTTGTLIFTVWVKLSALPASKKAFLSLYTTGTARRIDISLDPSNWYIDFYDVTNASLASVGAGMTGFSPVNQWIGYNVLLVTNGTGMDYYVRWLPPNGSPFFGIGPTTIASCSVGRWSLATLKAGGETAYADAEFDHAFMGNVDYNFVSAAVTGASNAYSGETAAARIARLSGEEGVAVRIDGLYAQSALMSYQTTDTYANLIFACADADMGVLCEARDALALTYRTHRDMELRRDVTVSMTSSHLSDVPLPTEDDQNIANDVTVTAASGASARYVKSVGALSTADPPNGVGTYKSGPSLSLAETELTDAAGWLAHLGTWDDARYPNLSIGMHRTEVSSDTALTQNLYAVDVGDTALLTALPAWMPPDAVPLLVQGYTEALCQKTWDITYNTTPAGPYETGLYNCTDVIGTPRYDTSGCVLYTANINTTATTIALNSTTSTDVWTSVAGSYPFDIMMSGERITLTAAPGGSTTPQTFTGCTRSVNGVVKAHVAGEPVTLADTRYYSR